MVIYEVSEDGHIRKHRVLRDPIADVYHGLLPLERIEEFKVHGIV